MKNYNEIKKCKESDHRVTPVKLYKKLDDEFHFALDPCPLHSKFDGLLIDWNGAIWINPPFSNIRPFVVKGILELQKGRATVCVYLFPSRTDTEVWHDLVLKYASEIRFIKGRLTFEGMPYPAPFPCLLVIFNQSLDGACKNSSYLQN